MLKKIYISLTSIFQNQEILLETLKSICCQTLKPDKIFLYLSEEPFLLDFGFANKLITNSDLNNFILNHDNYIILSWIKNTGPYRKLLPLLKDKFYEDCIIITIDDDTVYHQELIYNLYSDYIKQKCVINYRGFTPHTNKLTNFNYNLRQDIINKHIYNFPTGKGGILYHPSFFQKTEQLIFNEDIYLQHLPTVDDIWFYLVRICNGVDCYINYNEFMIKNNTNEYGLYKNFNLHKNTQLFLIGLDELKKIGYHL
jgi:hypothetical protein